MRTTMAVAGTVLLLVAAFGAVAPASASTGSSAGVGDVTSSHCSYPMTVTDATDTAVTVEEEPDRIVALAPSAAQNLWAVGAQDRVVGMPVDYHTGYLNGTEGKTDVVADDGSVINEQVVGANPDLVLAPNVVSNETVESLRNSGLTVYRFESADSLADVYAKIELYGQLVGNYEEGSRAAANMEGQVDAIRDAVSEEENPRVFFSLGAGWTTGDDSFIGDIIKTAGGDNIAAGELNSSYGKLSDEVVAQKDPEWIVINGEFGAVPKTAAFNESTAVQEGNTVTVNRDFMTQNGPKNLEPLKQIAAALHPDAYENIDFSAVDTPAVESCSTPTPSPTATETADGDTATAAMDNTPTATMAATDTPTEAEQPATTAEDGPGFTAATGIVALLAAVLLFRRR